MVNYYEVLELTESATPDEIKKAFRKLASKHHPDKGGDTAKFQEVQAAYDTLSDPNKKAQYDMERQGGGRQFHFHGGPGHFDINDLGSMFGFSFGQGFANPRQPPRNRDITVRAAISFKQSWAGATLEAKFKLPSGKEQEVLVDVPAGVHSGQTIRYQGMGDDAIVGAPRGNLNVQIIVEPDANFERVGNDLYTEISISAFDAMTGCTAEVSRIDDATSSIVIRPGVQDGTEYVNQGGGFKDLRTGRNGNFIIRIKVTIPSVTDPVLSKELKDIYAKISASSR